MAIEKFKVIKRFVNILNPKETYDPEDKDLNVIELDTEKDAERIENLKNYKGEAYIADYEEDEVLEYPHHLGGGTYELSNGEKVKGKEAAIEAENALNE